MLVFLHLFSPHLWVCCRKFVDSQTFFLVNMINLQLQSFVITILDLCINTKCSMSNLLCWNMSILTLMYQSSTNPIGSYRLASPCSLKLQCSSKISYDLSNVVFGTNCRTVGSSHWEPSIIQGISFCIIFDIFIMVSFELFSCKFTLNHSHYAVSVHQK